MATVLAARLLHSSVLKHTTGVTEKGIEPADASKLAFCFAAEGLGIIKAEDTSVAEEMDQHIDAIVHTLCMSIAGDMRTDPDTFIHDQYKLLLLVGAFCRAMKKKRLLAPSLSSVLFLYPDSSPLLPVPFETSSILSSKEWQLWLQEQGMQKAGWAGLADLLFTRPFHVDFEYHFDFETGLARA